MFIRFPFFALSDAVVPGLCSGLPESGLPCCSGADAACPGFRRRRARSGRRCLILAGDRVAAVPVCDLNIADGNGGRGATRACLFLFLFLKMRAGGAAFPAGAGSGVQDAGVLADRVVQVGGGDREGDVQVGQVVASPGRPRRRRPRPPACPARAPVRAAAAASRSATCSASRASSGTLPARAPLPGHRHPAPPCSQARPSNRSGQRATISPQASCQPWVTCPSISRGAAVPLGSSACWPASRAARLFSPRCRG